MKFFSEKKTSNAYIINEAGSDTVGRFVNGVFETYDPKIIEFLKGKYAHQESVEAPPIVQPKGKAKTKAKSKTKVKVEKQDDEDDLPEGKTDLKKMKASELRALMKELELTMEFGMTNDAMRDAIRNAR